MKKFLFICGLIALLLLVAFFTYPFVLNKLADFLVVRDPLEKADVIIVLGGDSNGERLAGAIELYEQGYAGRLLLSGGPVMWRLTYADWMKKQALAADVPAGAILLQDRSRSTLDDARFSLPIVQAHRFKSVILVTSPYHTRRASRVFKKMYAPVGIKIIVYPVKITEFRPQGWWTRHEDTAFVVWEYVSLVLYFLKGY